MVNPRSTQDPVAETLAYRINVVDVRTAQRVGPEIVICLIEDPVGRIAAISTDDGDVFGECLLIDPTAIWSSDALPVWKRPS